MCAQSSTCPITDDLSTQSEEMDLASAGTRHAERIQIEIKTPVPLSEGTELQGIGYSLSVSTDRIQFCQDRNPPQPKFKA